MSENSLKAPFVKYVFFNFLIIFKSTYLFLDPSLYVLSKIRPVICIVSRFRTSCRQLPVVVETVVRKLRTGTYFLILLTYF